MTNTRRSIPGVAGFRFASMAAGIKKRGGPDLGLIVADRTVPVAAVYTQNLVQAAPVIVARERTANGRARAVLVNSGCANACTGRAGIAATRTSTRAVARALGVDESEVVPASTGVIGALLPAEKIARNAPRLVAALSQRGAAGFADAICTTDRWPKTARARAKIAGETVTVLGIAKGAGMIHPDMATTLAFVVTDARISSAALRSIVSEAVRSTFNALSVDGDTSTNDTLLAMASGQAHPRGGGVRSARDRVRLESLFTRVLDSLARSIAADGEGAEHEVTIRVRGLQTDDDATRTARTIATSPLVKTALAGKDPNWGRILAAAGRAGVSFNPDHAAIRVAGVQIVRRGVTVGAKAEDRARARMQRAKYDIEVSLGRGRGSAHYVTCDFGHGYVDVNAGYRS